MNEFEKRDPGTFTGHDPSLAPEKVPGGFPPAEERDPGPAEEPTAATEFELPGGDDRAEESGEQR